MKSKHAAVLALVGLLLFVALRLWGGERDVEPLESSVSPAHAFEVQGEVAPPEEFSPARERSGAEVATEGNPLGDPGARSSSVGTCALEGRVVDADGNPVGFDGGRSSIYASDTRGARVRGSIRNGRYCFEGLPPGRYWVDVRADGERLEREVVVAPGPGPSQFDLLFPRGRKLAVSVRTPAGSAVHGLLHPLGQVEAVVSDRGQKLARFGAPMPDSVLNPWGRVRLPEGARPRVSLIYGSEEVLARDVLAGVNDVALVLDAADLEPLAARFTLQVVDGQTLAPLEDAYVVVENRGLPVDATGHIERTCAPGPHRIRIQHDDYAPREMERTLSPGGLVELGRVALGPSGVIEGRVLDDRNAHVLLKSYDRARGVAEFDPWRSIAVTLDDGRFEVRLAPGEYLVAAFGRLQGERAVSRWIPVDLDADASVQLELQLEPAVTVAVRTDRPELVGVGYSVVDSRGFPVATGSLSGGRPEVARLVPGDYTLLPELGAAPIEFRSQDGKVAVQVP